MTSSGGQIEAGFIIDRNSQPEHEAVMRKFFKAMDSVPSREHASGAKLRLTFPLRGNVQEISSLLQRILLELCGVKSGDPLNINFREK
jgi:hypothetical protein